MNDDALRPLGLITAHSAILFILVTIRFEVAESIHLQLTSILMAFGLAMTGMLILAQGVMSPRRNIAEAILTYISLATLAGATIGLVWYLSTGAAIALIAGYTIAFLIIISVKDPDPE